MEKEKKTRIPKLEKPEPDAFPLIVYEIKKSVRSMRTVKSKERTKETTSDSRSATDKGKTACETSGNIMRLRVNLMPVLASAKEPVEEEEEGEEEEENDICTSQNKPENNSSRNNTSVCNFLKQTWSSGDCQLGLTSESATKPKQPQSPWFVFPPITQIKQAPVEEGEEEEENDICTSQNKPENGSRNNTFVCKSPKQTFNSGDCQLGLTSERATKPKQPQSPRFVFPPITELKPAPGRCDCQKTQRCRTPLPSITLCQQETISSPDFTRKVCGGDAPVTRQVSDNPLCSNSRSAEFRLADISLSSLDALLQTVTEKLRRDKRGGDEASWRRVQSDHVLTSVRQQDGNMSNIGTVTGTSAGGCAGDGQMRLPPLSSAPKPTLIFMTKMNLLTSNKLQ
ncbi:uncharacterized protein [Embiotoca jacksoni]|uniref:uncharacterized protein n=1 Tax=Embiotoca jacksoni TaxID=100190 RepID=UPI0037041BFD